RPRDGHLAGRRRNRDSRGTGRRSRARSAIRAGLPVRPTTGPSDARYAATQRRRCAAASSPGPGAIRPTRPARGGGNPSSRRNWRAGKTSVALLAVPSARPRQRGLTTIPPSPLLEIRPASGVGAGSDDDPQGPTLGTERHSPAGSGSTVSGSSLPEAPATPAVSPGHNAAYSSEGR